MGRLSLVLAAPCGDGSLLLLLFLPGSSSSRVGPSLPAAVPARRGGVGEREGAVVLSAPPEGQPHPAPCPGRALLQPKQGRSSDLLRVGSGGRSRVSLIRLPSLIIPRELVGAVSLPPAPRAPLGPTCVSALGAACPGPGPVPKPLLLLSQLLHLQEQSFWGGRGPGRGFKRHQKGRQKIAPLQGVNV